MSWILTVFTNCIKSSPPTERQYKQKGSLVSVILLRHTEPFHEDIEKRGFDVIADIGNMNLDLQAKSGLLMENFLNVNFKIRTI